MVQIERVRRFAGNEALTQDEQAVLTEFLKDEPKEWCDVCKSRVADRLIRNHQECGHRACITCIRSVHLENQCIRCRRYIPAHEFGVYFDDTTGPPFGFKAY